jgi:hypothetical protein
MQRMASSIARAEQAFGNATAAAQWEETFLEALVHLDMLPNSPILLTVETPPGPSGACIALALEMGYSIAELASLLEPSAIAPLAMWRMGPSRIQMRALTRDVQGARS